MYKAKSKFRKPELVVAQSRTETSQFQQEPCEKVACTRIAELVVAHRAREYFAQRRSQLRECAEKAQRESCIHEERTNLAKCTEKEPAAGLQS